MSKPEVKEKEWHDQQEKILKRWSEIGSSYRYMHDRAYMYFNTQNMRFALPVIIISTVTGTANFAQGTFPEAWQAYVPLFIGFFNLLAGIVTTIAQFLRVSELLEGHRAASIAYSKMSRNISVELSLPIKERSSSGKEFIANARLEMDRLIEQSPNIPLFIVKEFGKKFDEVDFVKPDILDIRGVDVYKDERKLQEELERIEQEKLNKIKEKEEELRIKLETEAKEKEKAIKEEAKKMLDIEMKRKKELFEKRKKDRKAGIGIGSVASKMQDLISKLASADEKGDIITPPSSDNDSPISVSSLDNRSSSILPTDDILVNIKEQTTDSFIEESKKDDDDNSGGDGDDGGKKDE